MTKQRKHWHDFPGGHTWFKCENLEDPEHVECAQYQQMFDLLLTKECQFQRTDKSFDREQMRTMLKYFSSYFSNALPCPCTEDDTQQCW